MKTQKPSANALRAYISKTLLGLTLAASANAGIWLRCDFCQPNQAAATAVSSNALGEVVIYSLANNFALKFENEMQVVGDNCQPLAMVRSALSKGNAPGSWRSGGCSYQLVAKPMASTNKEEELQTLLRQIYLNTGGSMKTIINVTSADLRLPEGPITGQAGGSAFDFVNDAFFRGNVRREAADALNNPSQAGTLGNLANLITGAAATFIGADGTKIVVEITFSDGSSVKLEYSETSTPDSESAFTAEYGDVMTNDNMSQFMGDRDFANSLSMENFFANAAHLGVEIVRSEATRINSAECHSSIKPDGTVQVTCVRN
jgi:hypothetical protein